MRGIWWVVCVTLGSFAVVAWSDSSTGAVLLGTGALLAPLPIWERVEAETRFAFHKSTVLLLCILGVGFGSASPANTKRVAEKERKAAAAALAFGEAADPDTSSGKAIDHETNPYADRDNQTTWIGIGERAIKSRLKDPDSAKFKDVRFYSGGKIPVSCGYVNARNGFGGYDGFERFIAADNDLVFLESESSDGIGKVWKKFCVASPTDSAHID